MDDPRRIAETEPIPGDGFQELETVPTSRADLESAGRSAAVLARFLDVAKPGLWFDRMEADGRLVDEPSPASSF